MSCGQMAILIILLLHMEQVDGRIVLRSPLSHVSSNLLGPKGRHVSVTVPPPSCPLLARRQPGAALVPSGSPRSCRCSQFDRC